MRLKRRIFISEKQPIIKIPNWLFFIDEQYMKECNLYRISVCSHLYQNANMWHYTFFVPDKYCASIQKVTAAEKRNALYQANKIIEWLKQKGYLTEVNKYGTVREFKMSYDNLINPKPFVLFSLDEYSIIAADCTTEGKNKNAMLAVLGAIKYGVNRINDNFPKNVCSWSTAKLAKLIGVNKETFSKYRNELERIGLLKHKTIRIPLKKKNSFLNCTLNICTSDKDYIEHLKNATKFLKDNFTGKQKPAAYDDED